MKEESQPKEGLCVPACSLSLSTTTLWPPRGECQHPGQSGRTEAHTANGERSWIPALLSIAVETKPSNGSSGLQFLYLGSQQHSPQGTVCTKAHVPARAAWQFHLKEPPLPQRRANGHSTCILKTKPETKQVYKETPTCPVFLIWVSAVCEHSQKPGETCSIKFTWEGGRSTRQSSLESGQGLFLKVLQKKPKLVTWIKGAETQNNAFFFHIHFGVWKWGMSVEIREHLVGIPQSGCWALRLGHQVLPTEASCWPLLSLLCVKSAIIL